jgi:hypothetical protein
MSDSSLTLDKVRSKVRLIDNIAKMDAPELGSAMHTYGSMGQAGNQQQQQSTDQFTGGYRGRGIHRGRVGGRFGGDQRGRKTLQG